MSARLATGIWVSAYLRRLQIEGIAVYVPHKGDQMAGAVLVKLDLCNGTGCAFMREYDMTREARIWREICAGPLADVDAAIVRQRRYDPDLWVIEVEDARGRHYLDEIE